MVMQWSESLELELEPMDETHKEFVEHYNAVASAAPEDVLARLDALIAHTVVHFDQENRWMEAISFPSCHRAEHDRVLQVLRDVRDRLEKGDGFFARQLIQELPAWFNNHANTMDAALAFTLKSVGFDFERGAMPEGAVSAGCGCGTGEHVAKEAPAGSDAPAAAQA